MTSFKKKTREHIRCTMGEAKGKGKGGKAKGGKAKGGKGKGGKTKGGKGKGGKGEAAGGGAGEPTVDTQTQ